MNTHEDFSRHQEDRGPSDRSFGVVFAVFFALVGAWPAVHHRPMRLWAFGVAALFALMAMARPALLHPANRLWMRFGLLLAQIVNPIMTALLFYTVITPFALLMRALGKDPLRLRYDRAAPTYWIERDPPGPAPQSMSQQF